MPGALDTLIQARLSRPAPAGMLALADAARRHHGDNVLAVIGYGSCLRDGVAPDRIVDLYLLLEHYGAMPDNRLLRAGNRLLPPNVYYLETPFEGELLRAKYAALTLSAFEKWVGPDTDNPYFWARFAQPSALLHARDDAVTGRLTAAIAAAAATLLTNTLPLMPEQFSDRQLWTCALEQTYRTEWRSEGSQRAGQIIAADLEYYQRLAALILPAIAPGHQSADTEPGGAEPDDADEIHIIDHSRLISHAAAARHWRRRRLAGKVLATLRLMKAAFTFQGGIDYLLWKVARHSGVKLTPTEFQRRHPLLGAPALAWKLYRRGGFR